MGKSRPQSQRALGPKKERGPESHPRALHVAPVILRTKSRRQSFRDSYISEIASKVWKLTRDLADPEGVINEALSQMQTLCRVNGELHDDIDLYRSVLMGIEEAHRAARDILESKASPRTETRHAAALKAVGLTSGKSKRRTWPRSPGTLLLYLALRWGAIDPKALRDTAILLRTYPQLAPSIVPFLSQTPAEWEAPLAMPSKAAIQSGRRWRPLNDLHALEALRDALGAKDLDAVRVQLEDDETALKKRHELVDPGQFARRLVRAVRALPPRSKRDR